MLARKGFLLLFSLVVMTAAWVALHSGSAYAQQAEWCVRVQRTTCLFTSFNPNLTPPSTPPSWCFGGRQIVVEPRDYVEFGLIEDDDSSGDELKYYQVDNDAGLAGWICNGDLSDGYSPCLDN